MYILEQDFPTTLCEPDGLTMQLAGVVSRQNYAKITARARPTHWQTKKQGSDTLAQTSPLFYGVYVSLHGPRSRPAHLGRSQLKSDGQQV